MAKKQSNIGMFERAGRALGQANLAEEGYKQPYDYVRGINNAFNLQKDIAKKNQEENPEGNPYEKVPADLEALTTGRTLEITDRIKELGKIKKDDPTYEASIQEINELEGELGEFSNQHEQMAQLASDLDMRNRDVNGKANSMSKEQSVNMLNMVNKNYGPDGLDAKIIDGKYHYYDFTQSKHVLPSDMNTGSEYNPILYNKIEGTEDDLGFFGEILDIANKPAVIDDPTLWDRQHKPKIMKKVKMILKNDPNAAKNLIFQEDDFKPILESIMLEENPDIPMVNGVLDENSVEYMAAEEELKKQSINNDYFLQQLEQMFDATFTKAAGKGSEDVVVDVNGAGAGAQFNDIIKE